MAALPDHDLVDRTAQTIGGVATIFEKQGNDYVRISTNVKKENGDRAVGNEACRRPSGTGVPRQG